MPSPRDNQPRAEADRDPLDPFPTLLSSLRPRNAAPVPTYAAVARSPINEARTLPDMGEGSTSRRSLHTNGAGTANGSSGRNGEWTSDDVDRVDSLDEITTFPSSSPVFRASPPPPPAPIAGPSSGTGSQAVPVDRIATGPAFGDSPIRRSVPASTTARAGPAPVLGSVISTASSHRPNASHDEVAGPPTNPLGGMTPSRLGLMQTHRGPRRSAVAELEQALEGTWDEGMDAAARHLYGAEAQEDAESAAAPARTRIRNRIPILPVLPGREVQAGNQPPAPTPGQGTYTGALSPVAAARYARQSTSLDQIRRRLARLRADAGLEPLPSSQENRNNGLRTDTLGDGIVDLTGDSEDDDEDGEEEFAETAERSEYLSNV
jgi:hypothetical protein